ncbi:transposase [Paenibacillus sp. TRM 82003]|nr:transposase [Paenibacillus sp. TRM 82003]
MSEQSVIQHFFQRRWPAGFICPSCSHGQFYVISTRSLPLYQCKRCSRQTSVTSGTVMDKTRTSLRKWQAAIELLSVHTLNAKQLADAIDVTHKVAWTMLCKFREAIRESEDARKLEGDVYAGVWALAPKYIWMFLSDRHYRGERVLSLCMSTDPSGHPAIKIEETRKSELAEGTKQLTIAGRRRLAEKWTGQSDVRISWMNKGQMIRSSLMKRFEEVRSWLNEEYNGIGSKYLYRYLSEYCFRWNVAARNGSQREEWYRLVFRSAGIRS